MSNKFEKPSLPTETNVRYSNTSQHAEVEGVEVVGHLLVGAVGGNAIDISLNDIVDCQRRYGGEIVGVMTVVQHHRILSAVTAERDRLLVENKRFVDALEVAAGKAIAERDQLRAEVLELRQAAEQPPFAQKVVAKLRRFEECCDDSDSGGSDIGRHWLDLLTRLGLLNRVQRSPAIWEITAQGEDVLAAMAAKEGDV